MSEHEHRFVPNPGSFPFCESCGATIFVINEVGEPAPRVLVLKPEPA